MRELALANNFIGGAIDSVVRKTSESFLGVLNSCPGLRSLDLANNQLNDLACVDIFVALKQGNDHTPIEVLDLSRNNIGNFKKKSVRQKRDASKECSAFLKETTSLMYLNLAGNRIGATKRAARNICFAVSQNQSLTELDLSYNNLGDRPCMSLAKALAKCPKLRRLELACAGITSQGAEMLALAAQASTTLKYLGLSRNTLGRRGGRAIVRAQVFGVKSEEREVNIDGCDVTVEPLGGIRNLTPKGGGKPYPFLDDDGNKCVWQPTCPAGKYRFDLSDAYQRAQAQQAFDVAAVKLPKKVVQTNFAWDADPPHSYLNLSFKGSLSLTFSPSLSVPTIDDCIKEDRFEAAVRFLSRAADGSDLGDPQRLNYLQLLALECYVTPEQTVRLVSLFDPGDPRVDAAKTIFSRVVGPRQDVMRAMLDSVGAARLSRLEDSIGQLWHFCEMNPCGHYILDCADFNDRGVLLKLMQLAYTERRRRERQKPKYGPAPPDPSQKWSGEAWRNEVFTPMGATQGETFSIRSDSECLMLLEEAGTKKKKPKKKKKGAEDDKKAKPATTKLPDGSLWQIIESGFPLRGNLEFDFVPFKWAPVDTEPLSPVDFSVMLRAVQTTTNELVRRKVHEMTLAATAAKKRVTIDTRTIETRFIIRTLREEMKDKYVEVDQLLSLFEMVGDNQSAMVDILMLCWNRLVNIDQLYLVRALLTPPEPDEPPPEPVHVPSLLKGEAAAKVAAQEPPPPPDEWARVCRRIGWLNFFHPMHPEGPYKLNVGAPDERRVALSLLQAYMPLHPPQYGNSPSSSCSTSSSCSILMLYLPHLILNLTRPSPSAVPISARCQRGRTSWA